MSGVNHCGVYLEHLQLEHHQLNSALLEIQHQFAELGRTHEPQAALAKIGERLEGLLKELRSHFAEEEGGGCLEEVSARCPSLGPQIKELMGQHPRLTQGLERLISGLKGGLADQAAAQQEFDSFARELKTHEAAENRLLQIGLGGDASEYDAEGNE